MKLILDGSIQARIDSHNRVLLAQVWKSTSSLVVLIDSCIYFKDVDQRSQTFARAVEMSRLYSRRARTLVLRSAILKANISVKVKGGEKYSGHWIFTFSLFQCQAREQPEHGNFNNVPQ